MKNKSDKTQRSRATRLALLLAAVVGFFANVQAENRVTIDDFSIMPGEEKTVAVQLDNSDAISALQMDITFPKGLYYKDASITRAEERIDRDTHSISMNEISELKYRLTVLPSGIDDIVGNSGAVVYITVIATSQFTTTGKIIIDEIFGSSSHTDPETGSTPLYEIPACEVTVNPYVGKLYTAEDTLAIKTDGTGKLVNIVLDNYIAVRDMQLDVTLPQGMSFVTKSNGRLQVEYGDRLPVNAQITSNTLADGKTRIVIYDMTGGQISGETGTVFGFSVMADETLPALSNIEFSNVQVTDDGGNSYLVDDLRALEVTNSFIAHYTPANDSVQALRDMLAEAVADIEANAPDVKDSETTVAALADIEKQITDLQAAVDAAYADETLAAEYENVLAPSAAIIDAINKIKAEATSAQNAYTAITALNEAYAAAVADIETNAPDVKDSEIVANGKAAIEKQIADLQAAVDAAFADGSIVEGYDEILAPVAEVNKAIELLVANATSAQNAYAELNVLNESYAQAVAELGEIAPDVKDNETTVANLAAIEKQIADLQAAVDAAFAEGTLAENYDEIMAPVADITEAMLKLLEDANAGQSAYDVVKALNEAYDEAVAKLDEVAPNVKDNAELTEARAEIEKMIADLQAAVDAAYTEGTLAADYDGIMSKATEIENAINKLIEDATAAQKEYDDQTTGISSVDGNGNEPVAKYTLTGVRIDTPAKGEIYIEKYSDGSTLKRIAK